MDAPTRTLQYSEELSEFAYLYRAIEQFLPHLEEAAARLDSETLDAFLDDTKNPRVVSIRPKGVPYLLPAIDGDFPDEAPF